MKQLLVLSGKGGTGKTTIATGLIKLTKVKGFADCDVDAPNLHLVIKESFDKNNFAYYGMAKAQIDSNLCINCGKCINNCRFDAIYFDNYYKVNQSICEGCGVCEYVCDNKAISLKRKVDGNISLFKNRNKVFSTATLNTGSGNTGLLVTAVKRQLMDNLLEDTSLIIIDGSPGIGCPVIASIKGVDMVLIVAEASISGISDMKRIIETAKIFNPIIGVCINKGNINICKEEEIIKYCFKNNIPFLGIIYYDEEVNRIINEGKSIVDESCIAGECLKEIYKNIKKYI